MGASYPPPIRRTGIASADADAASVRPYRGQMRPIRLATGIALPVLHPCSTESIAGASRVTLSNIFFTRRKASLCAFAQVVGWGPQRRTLSVRRTWDRFVGPNERIDNVSGRKRPCFLIPTTDALRSTSTLPRVMVSGKDDVESWPLPARGHRNRPTTQLGHEICSARGL